MLKTITGLPAISMQPAAGAHGELTGLFVIRAYHENNGEAATRTKVLIPDSAHGTNPASVVLAGMKAVGVKTGEDGRVCFDDLVAKLADFRQYLARRAEAARAGPEHPELRPAPRQRIASPCARRPPV